MVLVYIKLYKNAMQKCQNINKTKKRKKTKENERKRLIFSVIQLKIELKRCMIVLKMKKGVEKGNG